jgi:hypothetical protein
MIWNYTSNKVWECRTKSGHKACQLLFVHLAYGAEHSFLGSNGNATEGTFSYLCSPKTSKFS